MPSPDPLSALALTIAAKSFSGVFQKLADTVIAGVSKGVTDSYRAITRDFQPHLEATFNRCTKIKTLISKEEPISLLDHYVELNFRCGDREYDGFAAIEEIKERKKAIIWGTAGAGKTVFMKYLWLTLFENSGGKIPLFVELRNLNDLSVDNLLLYVFKTIAKTKGVTEQFFEGAVKDGKFIFMLDGFDEIVAEKRSTYEKQILALANDNPKCTVIVSTRPDEALASWQLFSIFKVKQLTLPQVNSLVKKIPFDPKVKARFLSRLKKDLWQQHSSFLSSPLLATMMLMTFDQYADVPKKVHLFYEQAFDTLFSRHDAVKEAFKRRMYSNLPADVFKKYFSLFCLISYMEEKFEFTENEMMGYLERAAKVHGGKIDLESFVKDLLGSVCILQKDGLKFVFSHRSFQEFFSAYCLAQMPSDRVGEILLRLPLRTSDDTFEMLFDMNEDLLEASYVVPQLDPIVKELRECTRSRLATTYFGVLGFTFHMNASGVISRFGMRRMALVTHLEAIYPDKFGLSIPEIFGATVSPELLVELGQDVIEKARAVSNDEERCPLKLLSVQKDGGYRAAACVALDTDRNSDLVPQIIMSEKWFEQTELANVLRQDAKRLIGLGEYVSAKRLSKRKSLDEVFGL